jgi:DNA-binding Xre family transcriptional regulator
VAADLKEEVVLALADTAKWKQHDAQADQLAGELRDVERSLYRQTLRLEEQNNHARAIRFTTLTRICEALECQPGELLTYVTQRVEDPA